VIGRQVSQSQLEVAIAIDDGEPPAVRIDRLDATRLPDPVGKRQARAIPGSLPRRV
jgi:hypothetical protein